LSPLLRGRRDTRSFWECPAPIPPGGSPSSTRRSARRGPHCAEHRWWSRKHSSQSRGGLQRVTPRPTRFTTCFTQRGSAVPTRYKSRLHALGPARPPACHSAGDNRSSGTEEEHDVLGRDLVVVVQQVETRAWARGLTEPEISF